MRLRLNIVLGFLLVASLTACQGMVPQGAGIAPAGMGPAAQPEAGKDDKSDSASTPDAPPPGGPPEVFSKDAPANNDKPHAGGVSALPTDPTCQGQGEGAEQCGENKKTFDFTLTGIADPLCSDTTAIRYSVKGTVGAVLLEDGAVVPLHLCEVLVLHFQEGSGSTTQCQDLTVDENCEFAGTISLKPVAETPSVTLFAKFFEHPKPVCGETQWLTAPGKNDLSFTAASPEKLPECTTPTFDDAILHNFNLRVKPPADKAIPLQDMKIPFNLK